MRIFDLYFLFSCLFIFKRLKLMLISLKLNLIFV